MGDLWEGILGGKWGGFLGRRFGDFWDLGDFLGRDFGNGVFFGNGRIWVIFWEWDFLGGNGDEFWEGDLGEFLGRDFWQWRDFGDLGGF